jgi:hypothetical protein
VPPELDARLRGPMVPSEINDRRLRGVPPDLDARLQPQRVLPPIDSPLLRGVPPQLRDNTRNLYNQGRMAAQAKAAEVERQRRLREERSDMLAEARNPGNNPVNTAAKVRAKAEELLGRELFSNRTEAEAYAKQLLDLEEKHRLASKAAGDTKEYVKFGNMIKELKEQGEGAFLSDIDRQVLEKAKTLKDGSKMMADYIAAINSGDMSQAPAQLLEVRDALVQIGAASAWRDIITNYGHAGQMAGMFADKQAELNMLVASGRITADQASIAWADFIGEFKDFRWIDQTADALGTFVEEVTEDFSTVEDAFKNLIKSLARIALQETVTNPLKDWFRAQISGMYGGGATGQGGNATPGILGMGKSAVSTLIGASNQNSVANIASKIVENTGKGLSSIASSSGLKAQVNSAYAKNFQGFISELEGSGYKIKSLGGYNYRNIAGTNKLSNHSFGNAIDINPATNPDTGRGGALVTDMPSNVSAMAQKWGLSWGGDWRSKKDAMHFEVADSNKASAALEKLAMGSSSATTALGGTTNALAGFGGGLSNLAQSLMNVGGGSGGGGWFSGLMSLFGGAGGAMNHMMGISPAATMAIGGGAVGLFAEGGHVRGPGGPRSDSIPARLSNGEFVVNAAAVRGNRKILEAINNGSFGRFADGGFVFASDSAASGSGGMRASMGNADRQKVDVGVGVDEDGNLKAYVKKESRQQATGQISEYDWRQKRGGARANVNFHDRLKRTS